MTLQMQYAAHIHIACVVIADQICDYDTRDVYTSVCSVLHLECHFFILKSHSMIWVFTSLWPRPVEKRPKRSRLEIEIEWHSECNRLNFEHTNVRGVYWHISYAVYLQFRITSGSFAKNNLQLKVSSEVCIRRSHMLEYISRCICVYKKRVRVFKIHRNHVFERLRHRHPCLTVCVSLFHTLSVSLFHVSM